jgi:hypothetical protein
VADIAKENGTGDKFVARHQDALAGEETKAPAKKAPAVKSGNQANDSKE